MKGSRLYEEAEIRVSVAPKRSSVCGYNKCDMPFSQLQVSNFPASGLAQL